MRSIIIGSSNECDVIFEGHYVESKHLKVTIDETNEIFIQDLGSRFGTYINGKKISSKTKYFNKDKVKIGPSLINIQHILSEEADANDLSTITFKDFYTLSGKISFHDFKWSLLLLIPIFGGIPLFVGYHFYGLDVFFELSFFGYFIVVLLYLNLLRKVLMK
ncbi:FHA domain-containing protein [Flammeovirga sp. SJP92]|uniref:FHA domain-containing protein n=1 Tax=Flammeovirga sp. SJP92 TaxID=1775430 RepID=UPI000786F86D|nr:FHA domain-containing protein [Flammeovirga sp. SJP92]KXX69122.1 hypothetical protein AVL50_16930 [Flammeovirga sp. SJP92]